MSLKRLRWNNYSPSIAYESFSNLEEETVPPTILKKHHTGINQVDGTPQSECKFKDKTFEDMWNTATDTEILSQMTQYQTSETTYINFNEGELWRDLTDEEYYSIKRKWQRKMFNGRNVAAITKVKNGEHRRKKIYISLIRRRLIDPTITLEHLCYAALFELNYFIVNTYKDDYITRYQLTQMAQNAMNADLEKYKNFKENKKFKVNKMEANKRGLSIAQAVGKANGELRHKKAEKEYQELSEKYDKTLSVRKNAELLGVTKNKIYRLKKWLQEQEKKEVEQLPTNEEKTRQNASKYPQIEEESNMYNMCCEDMIRDMYRIIKNTFEPQIKKPEKMDLSWMKDAMQHQKK